MTGGTSVTDKRERESVRRRDRQRGTEGDRKRRGDGVGDATDTTVEVVFGCCGCCGCFACTVGAACVFRSRGLEQVPPRPAKNKNVHVFKSAGRPHSLHSLRLRRLSPNLNNHVHNLV